MPTENRSSNTELNKIVTEALVGMVSGVTGMRPPADEPLPGFIQAPIDRAVTRISDLLAQSAPQPHPEPIAWMVGTAFWWTKEEAARDAAATGLPIVGLGPMTGIAPAEQHQGDPVGEVVAFGKGLHEIAWATGRMPKLGAKLYTHADPGEGNPVGVEGATFMGEPNFQHSIDWYRQGISKHWKKICDLRTQIEDAQAKLRIYESFPGYLIDHCEGDTIYEESLQHWLAAHIKSLPAHAEQDAPNDCAICRDLGNQCMECEEAEFREWADRHFAAADYRKTDAGVFIQDWMRHAYGAWCARGALAGKQ